MAGALIVPHFSHASLLASLLKFFSGSGDIEERLPAIIPESKAAVDASALNAYIYPGALADASLLENPLNVVQDHAIVAPLNPVGVMASGEVHPSGQIFIYTVRRNDTLSTIAKSFDVSVNTIRWANNLTASSVPQPGDQLVILPVSGVRHEVKKGDTTTSIAKKYRASIDDIIQFNGLAPDEVLTPGTILIVPNGEEAAPVANGASPGQQSFSNLPVYSGYYLRPILGGRKTRGIHGFNGVDLANSCGLPVIASADGAVIIAKSSGWNGGYGEYVVITHGNGTQTLYGHLGKVEVQPDDTLAEGQEIGLIGSTGNSSGCHVHFEVRGARNPF